MSIIESHSIFSVYDLMDACILCIWLFWSPAVYFRILGWLIIMSLNKIFFTYQKKKKKKLKTSFSLPALGSQEKTSTKPVQIVELTWSLEQFEFVKHIIGP